MLAYMLSLSDLICFGGGGTDGGSNGESGLYLLRDKDDWVWSDLVVSLRSSSEESLVVLSRVSTPVCGVVAARTRKKCGTSCGHGVVTIHGFISSLVVMFPLPLIVSILCYLSLLLFGCLSRFQMLAYMLSLSDLICSGGGGTDGGSNGESGLDLLRDKDGNSNESSKYQ
nr:hypothetical protein [Tanacetum cinerariifolium]